MDQIGCKFTGDFWKFLLLDYENSPESQESNRKNGFWQFEVIIIENRKQKFPYTFKRTKIFASDFNGKNFGFSRTFYQSIPEALENVFDPGAKNFWNFEKKNTIYEEKVSLLYLEFEFIKQKHVKSGVSSMKN